MADRYYVATPITTDRAVLSGAEAHHLIHVMRAKAGSEATLFDGQGGEFTARIERIGRSDVELTVLEKHRADRELPFHLTLGAALPKGDRQKWLVEKAVELGVSRIVPLETARGVAQPVASALERLRRSVIEASKQCGRNRLMEIAEPQSWSEFLAQDLAAAVRWIAHPGSGGKAILRYPLPSPPAPLPGTMSTSSPGEGICIAIGPEGGFTDEEVAGAIAGGWQGIDLGPRILRVETAAIALAAIITHLPSVR